MPAPSEITLDQFIARLHAEVDAFAAKWRAEHAVNPEHWPAAMNEAEWHEQFLTDTAL